MDTFPAPVLRALEGLSEGSGRTLVIAGPQLSGKSELLQAITAQLVDSGHRVIELKGEYRERDTSYAALAGLGSFSPGPEAGPEALAPAAVGDGSEAVPSEPAPSELPTSALAYMTPDPGGGRRPRGERRRGMIMGQTYVTRPRAAESRDPQEFWSTMVADWRAHPNRGTAVLVEDAALVDPESREFLVLLSERARLRPFLIVLALDNGSPAFGAWEERLLGHGDVDWVKIPRAKPDPREAHRLKDAFERLPDRTQQVLGYTALMGGHVSEVSLSRVTRMNWRALADALLPATEAKLVKIDGTKVVIPHDAWIPLVPDLLPDDVRKEMHREIAEALAALNPEPSLVRRLELAEHYYQWYRGPNALRYLLETAELTERLSAFDTAEEVLEKALKCVPSLPVADRPEAEAELKLFHARVLVAGGRIHEGERALQEGVAIALAAQVPQDRLAEWVEAILPVLRAAGPRPSLVTHLMELADRCHDVGAISSEVLFQSVIAEYEVDRNRPEKARIEARRAVDLSRTVPRGPVQAMALLTVALTRVEGTIEEQEVAEKFLHTAEAMLGASRRYELQQLAEEVHVRLLEARSDRNAALRARERGVPLAQRMRALTIELSHQLGIAAILIERAADARVAGALKRAREITELLHLLPPSSSLLRLWVLEGRYDALTNAPAAARDRWEAIIDLPANALSPRVRAESLLRLSILEASSGKEEVAREYLGRLSEPEVAAAMRPEWREWERQVRRRTGLDPEENAEAPASAS